MVAMSTDSNKSRDSEDWRSDEIDDEENGRQSWSRKMDFILSCLSYAVGLGNVWRFPYICYKNGGGAFLIPFFIMLFITGIPLVFLELSFGQFASSGVVSIWSVSPIFQGVGWAMFIVSCLISVYYSMIIAWTIYYFFASFSATLPWSECGDWSSEDCVADQSVYRDCEYNQGIWYNGTCYYSNEHNASYFSYINSLVNVTGNRTYKSSSDEYFHKVVLNISGSVSTIGGLRWELAGCLLVAWILVCICLAKGIKSSGKAVYFTAFFPYVVLTILFIRGLLLEGSGEGVKFFLLPKWEQLLNPRVWKDGAVQIFFSLSPGWGGLITLASYNKFNNNTLKDAILVSVLDCLTSVFGGMVIFAIIGYMAHMLHQSVDVVASDGPGLAFVAYPYVVTKLPFSQLWSVLFFSMLITLGLGTQIATVTTVHTTLLDQFPSVFAKNNRRTFCLLMFIASICFLIGLSFCTQGGMYVVQIFDDYAATYSLLVIGMVEMFALGWIYGADRFLGDIELMLGKRPHKIWAYSWKFIAPIAILAILIFSIADFRSSKYENYVFPGWADGIGCMLSLTSILAIPSVAAFKMFKAVRNNPDGLSYFELLRSLSQPTPNWGPRILKNKAMMESFSHNEQDMPMVTKNKQDEPNGAAQC